MCTDLINSSRFVTPAETTNSPSNRYTVPFELEHHRNTNFTGRTQFLQDLDSNISDAESHVIVLQGMGGIGKTQILLEYVWEYHRKFSSIFWVDATTEETIRTGFRSILQRLVCHNKSMTALPSLPEYGDLASALGIPELLRLDGQIFRQDEKGVPQNVDKRIVDAVKRWWSQEENDSWLLILDNADDLKSFEICNFIPTSQHGTTLISSRRKGWESMAAVLEVELMDVGDAIRLLLLSAGRSDVHIGGEDPEAENHAAREIVGRLGCLPLAVDQAGAYITTRQIALQRYLGLYETNYAKIMKEMPQAATRTYRDKTIINIWEVSFEAMKAESETAAQLLLGCAFISNQDISEDMINRGMGWDTRTDTKLLDALNVLFSYSLAHRKGDSRSFHIHPLVHRWALERLDESSRIQKLSDAIKLVNRSLEYPGTKTPLQWRYEERMIPHMDRVRDNIKRYLSHLPCESRPCPRALGVEAISNVYCDWQRHESSETLLLYAFEGNKRTLGARNWTTIETISRLAWSYYCLYKTKEAEEILNQAMDACGKMQDDEHEGPMAVAHVLSMVYSRKMRLEDAEALQVRIIEISKRKVGKDHRDTIIGMSELAAIYKQQGRLAEWEALSQEVLVVEKRVLGKEHPDTLTSMHNIADVDESQGRLGEAEALYTQVIEARNALLGKEHPGTLTSMHNLAYVHQGQGRLGEAEALYTQVIEVRNRVLGKEHPDSVKIKGLLDSLFRRQGRMEYARALTGRTTEIAMYCQRC